MTPEEIQGDYTCVVTVEDYRVNKKAEFKVVVCLSFHSSRTRSRGSTSWHIWRGFTAFRKLDEQLRKRNATHLKGIKFPPLHRRRALFRSHLNAEFLERRMRELDTYLRMVTRSPQLVAFHVTSIQSQTLKAFVGFANGFGANPHYDPQDAGLRTSVSMLTTPAIRETVSVMGDDEEEDDFRSVSSGSTMTSIASSALASNPNNEYRWSGTGFGGVGSHNQPSTSTLLTPTSNLRTSMSLTALNPATTTPTEQNQNPRMSHTFSSSSASSAGLRTSSARGGSWFPSTESIVERDPMGAVSMSRPSAALMLPGSRASMLSTTSSSRDSFLPSPSPSRASMSSSSSSFYMNPSMGPRTDEPAVIPPEMDLQRAKMEQQLVENGLMGVGMPPDGSCLLHCVVYEMYPLQCLKDYPVTMTIVNVGAADGTAPRRLEAARLLRHRLMAYALEHVEPLAQFLMQAKEDLVERYETFRDQPDEQATIAELYAVASMFNIELVLITNDDTFRIDPVEPVEGLPSVRSGTRRTVTLGYLIPADGLPGHYICTRKRPPGMRVSTGGAGGGGGGGMPVMGGGNSFAGGSYRGSISIKPPPKSNGRRRLDRVPAQQRVE